MVKVILKDNHHALGSNNLFRIILKKGQKFPLAVLAQEYAELEKKRNFWFFLKLIFNRKKAKQELEYWGQEVQAQAMKFYYEANPAIERKNNVYQLKYQYPQFKGVDEKTISEEMAKLGGKARRWLWSNNTKIKTMFRNAK